MEPVTRSLRYRVNVSKTSTGKKSWDCTVDGEGYSEAEVLERSDALVKQLEARYPAEIAAVAEKSTREKLMSGVNGL